MSDKLFVVDDHLLLRMLLDDEPQELRPSGGRVFTTGLWYHRLCRSVGDRSVVGVFSRAIGRADPSLAAAAIEAVTRLPDSIDLLSLRELAWPMARLIDSGSGSISCPSKRSPPPSTSEQNSVLRLPTRTRRSWQPPKPGPQLFAFLTDDHPLASSPSTYPPAGVRTRTRNPLWSRWRPERGSTCLSAELGVGAAIEIAPTPCEPALPRLWAPKTG